MDKNKSNKLLCICDYSIQRKILKKINEYDYPLNLKDLVILISLITLENYDNINVEIDFIYLRLVTINILNELIKYKLL